MIFLHEKIIAIIFSVLTFIISVLSGLSHGTDLFTLMVRALGFGVVAFFIGLVFGLVIKTLFIETLADWYEREKARYDEAERKKKEAEDGSDEKEEE